MYFVCSKCFVWCKEPKTFDERTQFVYCPKCSGPMYLTHGTPSDDGYNEVARVEGTARPQRQ